MLQVELLVALSLCLSSQAPGLEVVEVFRADTPEELEAALADGYPPVWLAEMLSDESVPEEDRYWLDCRVRAVIAQDLHLFFDQDGNQVRMEADRIITGEDYWRECFVVNISGPDPEPGDEAPTGNWPGPGILVDRFGQVLGPIAITRSASRLSRDGSIGITQTGVQGPLGDPGLRNLCFFYPGGDFREFPIHRNYIHAGISESGELVVASCVRRMGDGESSQRLLVFDRNGSVLHETELELPPPSGPVVAPAVSPDDSYIAVQTRDRASQSRPVLLFDAETFEELHSWDLTIGNHLHFSPDSRYLCIAGGGAGAVVDCETGELVWSRFVERVGDPPSVAEIAMVRDLYCTNGARLVYWRAKKIGPTAYWVEVVAPPENQSEIVDVPVYPSVSPSGIYLVCQHFSVQSSSAGGALPMRVGTLSGGG